MAKETTLNDRQRAFVSYYLGDARGNATKAAKMAGYSEKTAYSQGHDLLKKPEITAAIEAELEAIRAEGIMAKRNRLEDYDELRRRLWLIVNERGEEHGKRGDPDEVIGRFTLGGSSRMLGGASGLLVRKFNVVGQGRAAKVIEEHQLDTGLISQLLNVDKQAAQELGEWSEKRQISGPDDGPIEVKSAETASEKLLTWLAQDEATEGSSEAPQAARD